MPITNGYYRGETLFANDLNASLALRIDRRGDEMDGPLLLSRNPQDAFEAATKEYVDAKLFIIPEAPLDGKSYGRHNATWVVVPDKSYVDSADTTITNTANAAQSTANAAQTTANAALARSGGTMTGALTLSADPAAAMQPVTLQYYNAHLPIIPPSYVLPIASATVLGGVKVGANLTIDGSGTLAATSGGYTLPIASASTLGGVMVGTGLAIDGSGVLSATGAGGSYLPLAGGALTGALSITAAANQLSVVATAAQDAVVAMDHPSGKVSVINGTRVGVLRWGIVLGSSSAEGGSNTGSDFALRRYNDAGTLIDNPILITRNSAAITFTGNMNTSGTFQSTGTITIAGPNNGMEIGSTSGANTPFIDFHSSGNVIDYDARLIATAGTSTIGNGTLTLNCGTFYINAASGVSFKVATSGTNDCNCYFDHTGAQSSQLIGSRGGSIRWNLQLGDATSETGGNAGTLLILNRYSDAGAWLAQPLVINRATGDMTLCSGGGNVFASQSLYSNIGRIISIKAGGEPGFSCYDTSGGYAAGMIAGSGQLLHLCQMDGGGNYLAAYATCRNSDKAFIIYSSAWKPGGGVWSDTSDIRLKRDIADYKTGLDEVCKLRPATFAFTGERDTPTTGKRYTGLVAQDVQEVMPELVETDADGYLTIDATPMLYAMVNAIRELRDRVEMLEG